MAGRAGESSKFQQRVDSRGSSRTHVRKECAPVPNELSCCFRGLETGFAIVPAGRDNRPRGP